MTKQKDGRTFSHRARLLFARVATILFSVTVFAGVSYFLDTLEKKIGAAQQSEASTASRITKMTAVQPGAADTFTQTAADTSSLGAEESSMQMRRAKNVAKTWHAPTASAGFLGLMQTQNFQMVFYMLVALVIIWAILLMLSRNMRKQSLDLREKVNHLSTELLKTKEAFENEIAEYRVQLHTANESQQWYRNIYETTGTATVIVEEDSMISMVNTEFERLTGHSRNDIEGKVRWLSLVHPDDATFMEMYHVQRLVDPASAPRSYEFHFIHKNGDLHTAFTHVSVIPGTKRSIVSFLDITVQKTQEKEVRLLAHALKSVSDCVSVTDMQDNILFVNDAFLWVYGYERHEIIGKPTSMLRPKNNNIPGSILEDTLHGGWHGEMPNVRKDGSTFLIELSTSVVRDDTGEPVALVGVSTDISERRRVETQMRFQSDILGNVRDGVIVTDISGRISYWNTGAEILFGYAADEMTGRSPAQLYESIDEQGVAQLLADVLDGREGSSECSARRKDGTRVWVDMKTSIMRDAAGNPTGVLAMIKDTSERRKQEQRYTKLNECLLSFGTDPVQNINSLVALCGEELNAEVALYNRMEGRMLHSLGQWNVPLDFVALSPAEGHICADIIQDGQPDVRLLNDLHFGVYAETDPAVTQYGLRCYLGKPVIFGGACVGSLCVLYRENMQPSDEDKKLLSIVSSAIGVEEERKRAEDALRESEESYRSLFENNVTGVYRSSIDGEILDCNAAFARLLGYDREQILGKGARMLYSSPDDRADFIAKLRKYGTLSAHETRLVRSDHAEVWVLESARLMNDGLLLGTIADITHRKEAQVQMERYTDELEKLNTSKDKFFSIISHDLRSPLSTLLGYTDLLMNDVDGYDLEMIKTMASSMNGLTKRIHSLLENLLEWSRLQAGRMEYQPIKVDLHDVVQDAVDLLQESALRKRLSIENRLNGDAVVLADQRMLRSVVQNLISNALKFSRPGETIDIVAEHIGGEIQLSVIDRGIGMSDVQLSNLFRIDVHSTTTGTAEEQGSGLGLILCKELVELNKGRIWAQSTSEKGSTFSFTIPRWSAN
jgi:PAS domain S-box-containing protein